LSQGREKRQAVGWYVDCNEEIISKDGHLKRWDGECSADRIDGWMKEKPAHSWRKDAVNSNGRVDEGEGRTDEVFGKGCSVVG